MQIRNKKDEEDEVSFADTLSDFGDALVASGKEEEKSTLESLKTITKAGEKFYSAWAARTEKNRAKQNLPNVTESGNPIGEVFSKEYNDATGVEAFTASGEDSELFNNAVKGQLDLDDPKNAVTAKAFDANKKVLDKNEGMSYINQIKNMQQMDPDKLKKFQIPWGMGR
tara:strand:- start:1476 stop:1982 length:507 start_codon:yes stop_codon:yes gene_type:complete